TLRNWIADGAKWDAKTLAENASSKPPRLVAMPPSYQPVLALALSPDQKRLALARGNRICIHNLSETNRPRLFELDAGGDAVQSLAWSADGKWLASGGFRRIVLWSSDGSLMNRRQDITNGLVGRITTLQCTANGATWIVADGMPTQSGLLHFIRLEDDRPLATLQ